LTLLNGGSTGAGGFSLSRFVLRLVLLSAGLVFAASLVVVATALLALWGVRYLWARLTGKPVAPMVFRVDPRAGFGRVYRGEARSPFGAPRPRGGSNAEAAADVTDVVVKDRP
jgi:hypothetical protein